MFRKSRIIEEGREQTDAPRLPDTDSPEPVPETSGAHADLPHVDRWPAPPGSPKLGELLVQNRFVTHAQLSEALLQQSASGKRLGTLLVELGILDERNLARSEEHTSELQSRGHLVCRLLLEKKKHTT